MSLDLDAIKDRAEAATLGRWEAKAARVYLVGTNLIIAACWRPWGPVTGAGSIEADAAFIAHARSDVPALVVEVERLRAENADLKRNNHGRTAPFRVDL